MRVKRESMEESEGKERESKESWPAEEAKELCYSSSSIKLII